MATVTIDGQFYDAAVDATILDVARGNGVWIPTLCHHPALQPYAACRLCMVEVDRGSWRQMVTACNYPVRGDLAVYVNSERAIRARQGVLKLLLARAPDCKELQQLGSRMGVAAADLPTVTVAERNCILCGLCVRACEEQIGTSSISLTGRGVERKVSTPFDAPSDDCIVCGACAAVCPVGTIEMVVHGDEIEIVPFGTKGPARRCAVCGAVLAAERLLQALRQRSSAAVQEILEGEELCSRCRRQRSASAVTTASGGGAAGPPRGYA